MCRARLYLGLSMRSGREPSFGCNGTRSMIMNHSIIRCLTRLFFTVTLERPHARRSVLNIRTPRRLTFTGEWVVAVAGSASMVILVLFSPSSPEPPGHLYVALEVATAGGGVGTNTCAAVACCAPRPCNVLQLPRQGVYGCVGGS